MYYPAVHLTFTCFSKIQLEYLLDTFNIYFHPNRADEVLSGFFFSLSVYLKVLELQFKEHRG